MKATGIVRRIDDLGRVVVPKEIRKVLRIREGDPMEIYTGTSGEIILKKYSPINELSQFASEYVDSASNIVGGTVLVCDTDQIVAAAGKQRKEHIEKRITQELDEAIQSRREINTPQKIVIPIISQGDIIGAVSILSQANNSLDDSAFKIAKLGADFLARQMLN